MTEKQIQLVKSSWGFVAGELEDLCNLFTKQLIRLKPELKPLLKKLEGDKKIKETMTTVNHLVESLNDFKKAEKNVMLLIAGYADISVSREDYDTALIAFLMTLEKKIGRRWSIEIREAWIFIFVTAYQHFMRQLNKRVTLLETGNLAYA